MKLGKKAQYAILFVLYLARSGRARTADVAEGLGLSSHFLEQVARKLRQAGIIKSVRGPGGGYELSLRPTVGQILEAVSVPPLLTKDETTRFSTSSFPEYRALAEIVGTISSAIGAQLQVSAVGIADEVAKQEGRLLGSLNEQSTVQ